VLEMTPRAWVLPVYYVLGCPGASVGVGGYFVGYGCIVYLYFVGSGTRLFVPTCCMDVVLLAGHAVANKVSDARWQVVAVYVALLVCNIGMQWC
jgi:hypothetical protein